MNIALKNFQEKQADIYNLWKYPFSGSSMSANPSSIFLPDFNKWSSASDTGYILANREDERCKYGNGWFSVLRKNGYQAASFVDLDHGIYTINFDCGSQPVVFVIAYIKQLNGYVKYGGSLKTFVGQTGKNEFELEIPQGICPMFQFFIKPEGQWGTFSEILIR